MKNSVRRRWLWIGGFLAVIVATPFVVSLIGDWRLERELEALYAELDADDPRWRWEEMIADQPKPPPDAENAALHLAKVGDLLEKTPFWMPSKVPNWLVGQPANNRLSAEVSGEIRRAFARLPSDLLDEARKLKDMPNGRILIEPWQVHDNEHGPLFFVMFNVVSTLRYDAVRRGDDLELEEAAASCQAILNGAHALRDYPSLMAHLVRRAGQEFGGGSIERLLGQGELSEKSLRTLQAALEREADHDDLYAALRGERVHILNFYLRLRAGETTVSAVYGSGNRNSLKRRAEDMLLDAFPGMVLRTAPEEIRLFNEFVAAARLRGHDRVQAFRALQSKHESSPRPRVTQFYATLVLGAIADGQTVRCAAVAVAAERFRVQHDRWPVDAEELVKAQLLREIPKDAFDGQPLRWRRTPAGLAIYSIGVNQIDDTEKLRPDENRVATADNGFVLWDPPLRHVAPNVVEK